MPRTIAENVVNAALAGVVKEAVKKVAACRTRLAIEITPKQVIHAPIRHDRLKVIDLLHTIRATTDVSRANAELPAVLGNVSRHHAALAAERVNLDVGNGVFREDGVPILPATLLIHRIAKTVVRVAGKSSQLLRLILPVVLRSPDVDFLKANNVRIVLLYDVGIEVVVDLIGFRNGAMEDVVGNSFNLHFLKISL